MTTLIVNALAAFFAFAAGALWYLSGTVKTPDSFSVSVDISQSSWDGSTSGTGYSTELLELGHALKRQSRFSRYAAFCACAAAFLQGAVLVLAAINSQ